MIPIYIINMLNHIDRKNDLISSFPLLFKENLTFIEASNGNEMKLIEVYEGRNLYSLGNEKIIYDPKRRIDGKQMSKGEIGCSHSHIKIYKKMIDENIQCACILEDDVRIINVDNLIKLFEWCKKNSNSFECIQCAKDIQWNPITRLQKCNFPDIDLYNIQRNFFNNSSSYILSLNGAKKLYNFSKSLNSENTEISVPSDDLISNAFVINYLQVIVPKDMPFYIDFKYKSSTTTDNEENKKEDILNNNDVGMFRLLKNS